MNLSRILSVTHAFLNPGHLPPLSLTRIPFTYLGKGWTYCAEIWCVVRDPIAMRFTETKSVVHLQVRTCVPLSVSRERMDAFIALNHGAYMGGGIQ